MKKLNISVATMNILSSKKFMRLNQISLAVDYSLQEDTAQSRYSHSIEVATTVQIMVQKISKLLGINVDPRELGYIVGLLHDIGHTSFSHMGERTLKSITEKFSGNKLSFEGNSNNYVTIKKNNLIKGLFKEDQNYVLASLAKHPEELYEEQQYLHEVIKEEALADSLYLRESGFPLKKNLEKTLLCQIMDVADENSYIVSDIVDSLNIFKKEELKEIFKKEISNRAFLEEILKSLEKSKNDFRIFIREQLYFKFIENFSLNEEGVLYPMNEKIETLRLELARINRQYTLKSEKISVVREQNKNLMERVFLFHFQNPGKDMPSSFYKKQFDKASNEIEKLKIVRNMCGSFTDKGLKQEYKRLFKGEKK